MYGELVGNGHSQGEAEVRMNCDPVLSATDKLRQYGRDRMVSAGPQKAKVPLLDVVECAFVMASSTYLGLGCVIWCTALYQCATTSAYNSPQYCKDNKAGRCGTPLCDDSVYLILTVTMSDRAS